MTDKMPGTIYVYDTKLGREITYWPHHGNRKTVKYHRALVSKEDAEQAYKEIETMFLDQWSDDTWKAISALLEQARNED